MNESIKGYLEGIGAKGPVVARAAEAIDTVAFLTKKEIKDVFVSETIQSQDGEERRVYLSLFMFCEDGLFEAKNFLHEDTIDYARLDVFGYWEIKKRDFNLKGGIAKSRLAIKLGGLTSDGLTCVMKASGMNCEKLLAIFIDLVLPKMRA